MENKMKTSLKLLCVAIAAAASGNALAAPFNVDGINTGGSEYANTADWIFTSTHGDTKGDSITGSMSYGIDADTIYVLLSVPADYTNNYYGSEEALGGWEPGAHSFDKLRKSDKLVAQLQNIGGPTEMEIDYLSDNTPYVAEVKKGGALIQDVATSLEYNLTLDGGGACGDTTNSNIAGDSRCVAQVIYEFSLATADFSDFGFGSVLAGEVHASPNTVPSPTDPPTSVPEPSVFAMLLAGLPGLLWTRRRRTRAS